MQDRRGGRHGVAGHELAAAEKRPQGEGLVPVEFAVIARLRGYDHAARKLPAGGKIPALRQGAASRFIGGRLRFCGVRTDEREDEADEDGARGRNILERTLCLRLDLPHPVGADEDAARPQRWAVPSLRLAVVHGDDHVPGSAAQCMNGLVSHTDHVEIVAAPDPRHVVLRGEEMVAHLGEKLRELHLDGKHPLPGFPADQYIEFHGFLPRSFMDLRSVMGAGVCRPRNGSFTGGDGNSVLRKGPRAPSRR